MGDEADADWQAGLVEWGIEDTKRMTRHRNATPARKAHNARSRYLHRQRSKARKAEQLRAQDASAGSARNESPVGPQQTHDTQAQALDAPNAMGQK